MAKSSAFAVKNAAQTTKQAAINQIKTAKASAKVAAEKQKSGTKTSDAGSKDSAQAQTIQANELLKDATRKEANAKLEAGKQTGQVEIDIARKQAKEEV